MKLKATFVTIIFSSALYMGYSNLEPYNFAYKFMVIANSYDIKDEKYAFEIKEKLINKYESLCFGLDESYHKDVILTHIDDFEFSNNITSYYSNGMIVLRIGSGIGYVIKGNLRKNACDDSTINEKMYFFELFK